jgi:hypothetical protein
LLNIVVWHYDIDDVDGRSAVIFPLLDGFVFTLGNEHRSFCGHMQRFPLSAAITFNAQWSRVFAT